MDKPLSPVDAGPESPEDRPPSVITTAADLLVPAVLATAVVTVLVVLHTVLTRPLWYDEIWRPHFLSEPPSDYWSELAHANTPSALGWAALTRAVGDVLGWHAWALRLPELVALVALPVLGYAFIRRFAGVAAAGLGGAALGLSGVLVDLGTQLKPYSIEALASLVIVRLWIQAPGTEPWHRRLGWRTAAGMVALFSVPAVFLLVPLAAVDVASAGYGYRWGSWRVGWRHRLWAGLTTLPAVGICGLHTVLFVGHQSSQRASQFWDTQFLAGRGLLGGLGFVVRETIHILGGAPTGIDRYDPNLVHPRTDPTLFAAWLLAPAAAAAFAAGAVALARGGRQGHHRLGNARRLADPHLDEGRYVVGAALGALVLALVASAGRYWPFGANRTNTFLVPLLVTIVATGADRLARRAVRPGPLWDGPASVLARLPLVRRLWRARRAAPSAHPGTGHDALRGTQADGFRLAAQPTSAFRGTQTEDANRALPNTLPADTQPASAAGTQPACPPPTGAFRGTHTDLVSPARPDSLPADLQPADTFRGTHTENVSPAVPNSRGADTQPASATGPQPAGPPPGAQAAAAFRGTPASGLRLGARRRGAFRGTRAASIGPALPGPGAFRPAQAASPPVEARRFDALRGTPRLLARFVLVAVTVLLVAAPVASASALWPLWRQRHEIRPVALMGDATAQARGIYRPGDLVVVGGRLARSGWLYAMDVGDDGPYLPQDKPGRIGPRIPTNATVFLTRVGAGQAGAALAARPGPTPSRILLFVLSYDRAGTNAELATLRSAGWCATQTYDYPNTGALRLLNPCLPPAHGGP